MESTGVRFSVDLLHGDRYPGSLIFKSSHSKSFSGQARADFIYRLRVPDQQIIADYMPYIFHAIVMSHKGHITDTILWDFKALRYTKFSSCTQIWQTSQQWLTNRLPILTHFG